MKRVLIVGGGFAGVRLARKLKKQRKLSVTLVNDSPYFRYYPALYRAATGFKMGIARLPLEWMLLDIGNLDLLIDSAVKLDPSAKYLTLSSGKKIEYDYLALALGSVTTYFNIEGMHEHSYGIKSADEISQLREHLHSKIISPLEEDENYVIVGAGPTGVELAGALGAYLRKVAKKHKAKGHKINIWLVEAGPRILPQFSERAAKLCAKKLKKLRVKILTSTTVTRDSIHQLSTSSGNIKTHSVIWTAGTTNNPFFQANETHFELNERGRVVVDEHLRSQPDVYVMGDNNAAKYSGLAFTAVKQADFVASDIKTRSRGRSSSKAHPISPPMVLPLGNSWSVLQYGKLVLAGRVISWLRRAADYIGYSDVLGPYKALTIWADSEKPEDMCQTCHRSSSI